MYKEKKNCRFLYRNQVRFPAPYKSREKAIHLFHHPSAKTKSHCCMGLIINVPANCFRGNTPFSDKING